MEADELRMKVRTFGRPPTGKTQRWSMRSTRYGRKTHHFSTISF